MGSRAKSELCVSENGSKIRYRQSGYDSEMTPVRNHSKSSLSNRKLRPSEQHLKLHQPRKPSLSKDSHQSSKKKDIIIEASTSIFDHNQADPNYCSQLKLQINDRVIDLRELLLKNHNKAPTAMTPATKDLQDITNIEIKLGKHSAKKKRSNKKSQRKAS